MKVIHNCFKILSLSIKICHCYHFLKIIKKLQNIFYVQGVAPFNLLVFGLTTDLAELVDINLTSTGSVSIKITEVSRFIENEIDQFFIRIEALGSQNSGLVPLSLEKSAACERQLEESVVEIFNPVLEKTQVYGKILLRIIDMY